MSRGQAEQPVGGRLNLRLAPFGLSSPNPHADDARCGPRGSSESPVLRLSLSSSDGQRPGGTKELVARLGDDAEEWVHLGGCGRRRPVPLVTRADLGDQASELLRKSSLAPLHASV